MSEMEGLRKEMNAQMSSLRDEIKQMTRALTELIRLDGEMKAQNGALNRIGRQVDDHELRLRTAEVNGTVNKTIVSSNERLIWSVVTGLLGLAFFFLKG